MNYSFALNISIILFAVLLALIIRILIIYHFIKLWRLVKKEPLSFKEGISKACNNTGLTPKKRTFKYRFLNRIGIVNDSINEISENNEMVKNKSPEFTKSAMRITKLQTIHSWIVFITIGLVIVVNIVRRFI